MKRTWQGTNFLTVIAGMLMASPALANTIYDVGVGQFVMVVGFPLSVVTYFIAAVMGRMLFERFRSWVYWLAALLGLFPWVITYLFLDFVLPDGDLDREIWMGFLLSLLPIALVMLARNGRSRRRARRATA